MDGFLRSTKDGLGSVYEKGRMGHGEVFPEGVTGPTGHGDSDTPPHLGPWDMGSPFPLGPSRVRGFVLTWGGGWGVGVERSREKDNKETSRPGTIEGDSDCGTRRTNFKSET